MGLITLYGKETDCSAEFAMTLYAKRQIASLRTQ